MNIKLQNIIEFLNLYFPNQKFTIIEKTNFISITLANNCRGLQDSKFSYDSNRRLVHFTSLNALISIIEYQMLKFNNLYSLKDGNEFSDMAKKINPNNTIHIDSKKSIFSASFCEEEILGVEHKQRMLWDKYGSSGHGAALVFKIDNSPLNWKDHVVSKVNYDIEKNDYDLFFSKLKRIQDTLNKNFPYVHLDIETIYSFFKQQEFEYESEIRMIIDCRENKNGFLYTRYYVDDNLVYPIIKEDSHDSNKRSIYLPLNYHLKESIPLISIDKIILGYNIENYEEVKNEIISIYKNKHKNLDLPDIVKSNLSLS
jgi:hypothetical protein